jgi:hypothetical protein
MAARARAAAAPAGAALLEAESAAHTAVLAYVLARDAEFSAREALTGAVLNTLSITTKSKPATLLRLPPKSEGAEHTFMRVNGAVACASSLR